MSELITLQEVASCLRVTEKTVHRLLWRGAVPATKMGHQWRFDKNLFDEQLYRNTVGIKVGILVTDDGIVMALLEETLGNHGKSIDL